jgi:MmoB/DmpM family
MTGDVGPVLRAGGVARTIVAVLAQAYPDAVVVDRGAYVRVLVTPPCILKRAAIEERTGEPFRFPQDLEAVMVSFRGRLHFSDVEATWEAEGHG